MASQQNYTFYWLYPAIDIINNVPVCVCMCYNYTKHSLKGLTMLECGSEIIEKSEFISIYTLINV